MTDLVRRSMSYLLAQPAQAQWGDFLSVLGETLSVQMGTAEVRSFFSVLGRRIARRAALESGLTVGGFESAVNQHHAARSWGFVSVAETPDALEITHACGALRQAFGDDGMAFAPAFLEGLYAEWLSQQGAGADLKLRQIGQVEQPMDVLRFKLSSVH